MAKSLSEDMWFRAVRALVRTEIVTVAATPTTTTHALRRRVAARSEKIEHIIKQRGMP